MIRPVQKIQTFTFRKKKEGILVMISEMEWARNTVWHSHCSVDLQPVCKSRVTATRLLLHCTQHHQFTPCHSSRACQQRGPLMPGRRGAEIEAEEILPDRWHMPELVSLSFHRAIFSSQSQTAFTHQYKHPLIHSSSSAAALWTCYYVSFIGYCAVLLPQYPLALLPFYLSNTLSVAADST